MRSMLKANAIRALGAGIARGAAPRLAGALLFTAGALMAIILPVAAVRSAVPFGPLLMWVNWMALFGATAVAVLAKRRIRRLEAALQRERQRSRVVPS